MALQNPFHILAAQPPKRVVGPQNIGLVGGGIGGNSNPNGLPGAAPPPPAPAAAPAAAAAPPPPDFNALTLTDPHYTTGVSDLQRNNDLAMQRLLQGFKGTSQSYQDNANAHNALFSGAAVHAQNYAAQNYADQSAQQAQNLQSGQHNLYNNVWNRLLTQLAGGGA